MRRWPGQMAAVSATAQACRTLTPTTGSPDVGAALGDPPHRIEEDVDLLVGVVEGERRADRRLEPQSPQRGLRAVMTRAHRDSLGVQRLAHLARLLTREDGRKDAGPLLCGAPQARTGG